MRIEKTNIVAKIQKGFEALHKKDENLPLYKYNKSKRFFYNKHLKNAHISDFDLV